METVTRRGLDCQYEGRSLFADYQDWKNETRYQLGSQDRKYVIPNSNVTLDLACYDCECRISTGSSSGKQMLTLIVISAVTILLFFVLKKIILCLSGKCTKPKST